MMDPEALARLTAARRTQTLAELAREVLRGGRASSPRRSTRSPLAGNATMTALALGIDPEPLGVAPFVMSTAQPARGARHRARARPAPAGPRRGASRPSARTSAATSSPACSPPGWTATSGCGCSSTSAPTARSCSATATRIVSTAAPAGPAFEGGAIRCGMRAADGAIEVVKIDPASTTVRPAASSATSSRRACAGPASSTPSPSWSGSGCSTAPAGSSPTRRRRDRPRTSPTGSTAIGEERVFVLHRPEPDSPPERHGLPVPARRPRAAVRQGAPSRPAGRCCSRSSALEAARRAAGAARRLVRQLPVPGHRGPDRAGAEAPGAADRLRRQRRRRGREDGAAEHARARGRRSPCWRR